MNLKPNSKAGFTQACEKQIIPLLRKEKGFRDEITFVSQDGAKAVGISLWDQKENAEVYNRETYAQVLKALEQVVEGTPQIVTYEVSNSTSYKIAAQQAA
jgi:hypothetical protein